MGDPAAPLLSTQTRTNMYKYKEMYVCGCEAWFQLPVKFLKVSSHIYMSIWD